MSDKIELKVKEGLKPEEYKEDITGFIFTTGCDIIDMVVGGGKAMGYSAGNVINYVGDKSTGKSYLASEMIAANRHKHGNKFHWRYDDCERGYTFDSKRIYGFEIIPKGSEHSKTVEELENNINIFLKSVPKDQGFIYVVDSLDGLASKEIVDIGDKRQKAFEDGEEYEKGSYYMKKNSYLSQEFFPRVVPLIEERNGLLLIISQVRDNIDTFSFQKYRRQGGHALDHNCHTILWLKSLEKMYQKGLAIGTNVEVKTSKSKTPRPFREGAFSFLFEYGVDNIGSNLDYLYGLRTDSGKLNDKAKSISWDDSGITLDTLEGFLEEQGLLGEARAEIKKYSFEKVVEWIGKKPTLFKPYTEKFGEVDLTKNQSSMSRFELINHIEENSLQNILTKRVIDKWEALEEEVKVRRMKKY